MSNLKEHSTTAGKKFAATFWEGFGRPKTLPNAVQHFATMYPDADEKTKNTFAQYIVKDCIIMKKVDERKLAELIDDELSKTDTRVPTQERDHSTMREVEKVSVFHADRMDGQHFEEFVAEILRHAGYTDVEVTCKSGDQGGDVLAKKDGQTIVIQAKRHTIDRKVSNSAVQEAYGAQAYYSADIGAVITNTLYTKSAKDLASTTGVVLWDRQDLTKFIAKYNEEKNV